MLKMYKEVIGYSRLRQTMSDKDLVNKKVFSRQEIYEYKALSRDIGYSSKTFKSSLVHTLLEVGLLSCNALITSILGQFAFLAFNALFVALTISLTVMGVCLMRLMYFRNAGISEDVLFLVGYLSESLDDFAKNMWG